MSEERTTEIAEFEADLRRTASELIDHEHVDVGAMVRQRARRYWDEYFAMKEVAVQPGREPFPAEEVAQFANDRMRTREELRGASLDIGRVVFDGAREYWSRRRGTAIAPDPAYAVDSVRETAAMLDKLSVSLDPPALALAEGEVPLPRALRLMALSFTVIVGTLAISSLILIRTTDIAPSLRIIQPLHVFGEHTSFTAVSIAMVLAVLVATLFLFRRPDLRRLGSIAMGGVTAAAVLAIFGIAYLDARDEVQQTEGNLRSKLLSQLNYRSDVPVWDAANAKYTWPLADAKLNAADAPLYVALLPSRTEAELTWHLDDDRIVNRGVLVIGNVQNVNDHTATLRSGDRTLTLQLRPGDTVTQGERLIVQVGPNGKTEWLSPARVFAPASASASPP